MTFETGYTTDYRHTGIDLLNWLTVHLARTEEQVRMDSA